MVALAALSVAAGVFLLRSTPQRERAAHPPVQPGAGGDPATPVASKAIASADATDPASDRPRSATAGQHPSAQPPKPSQEEPPQAGEPDIRLNPPPEELGVLRIEVLGPEGAPVTGAALSLHRADFCGQDATDQPRAEGRTDGDGVALLERLAVGAWHVVVTSRGGISWRGEQPRGQAHAAAEVKTKGLSRTTIALDVGLVIAGRVVVPGEKGFRDVSVVVSSEIGCGTEKHPVKDDGTFRIDGLCRGPWRCHATSTRYVSGDWPGPDIRPIANSAAVLITESREDVELVLRIPSLISGRLLGSELEHFHQGIAVNLDTQHRYGLWFDGAEFSVSGADPGVYLLAVYDPLRWGIVGGIQVEEGSTVAGIEIPLEPAARLSLPASAEDGLVSVFLDGVLLPLERGHTMSSSVYSVPPRHLDVELRLDGKRHSWTVDALAGQTHVLSF